MLIQPLTGDLVCWLFDASRCTSKGMCLQEWETFLIGAKGIECLDKIEVVKVLAGETLYIPYGFLPLCVADSPEETHVDMIAQQVLCKELAGQTAFVMRTAVQALNNTHFEAVEGNEVWRVFATSFTRFHDDVVKSA